jgi:hypothetical protein
MDYGQMPSKIYDMIKYVRGDGGSDFDKSLKKLISVDEKFTVTAKVEPDLDLLSPSDIECLNESIKKYGKMTFKRLLNASHSDQAYLDTPRDHEIKLESIIDTLENKKEIKSYLKNLYQ